MDIEDNCRIEGIKSIVATDFDGTLLRSNHTISGKSLSTLKRLGQLGILRVIVTGRSLFSLKKVLTDEVPIDYLIVASGSGIYCPRDGKLLYKTNLSSGDTEYIGSQLIDLDCDFMVHYPLPDNHKFFYHHKNKLNLDYKKRFEIYVDHAELLSDLSELQEGSSQFLIVDLPEGNKYDLLCKALENYTVIRTTSPIDLKSPWIEIFPPETDKGKTLKLLAENYGLGSEDVLSIGNDFNDLHMLRWANESRVVSNAHSDLKAEFKTVKSNDEDGFSEAVEQWLTGRN